MYKFSLAAGALAALHGAWAQDSFPAEHTEEIKGYEGQYVDACNPVGTVRYNSTFPPCISASRIESSCAVAWKEGLSDEKRQGDWEAERKCLCDGSFFDDVGKGCPDCKKAYGIESEENTNLWLGGWSKMRGDYCKADGALTGNFSTYWNAAFGEVLGKLKYPVEGDKVEAGSIPIEDYYKNDKQGPGPLPGSVSESSSNSTNSTTSSGEAQGVAQLTPDCRNLIGAIDTLPASNSAKFSNSSSGAVLVSVQTIFNRICIINGAEREIKAHPKAEPEVKPISQEVTTKEKAAEKAEIDMTACPCAEKALPQGKQAVRSESSVKAWTMVSVIIGFEQAVGCGGPQCGGAGGAVQSGADAEADAEAGAESGAQAGAESGAQAGTEAGAQAGAEAGANVYTVESVKGTFGKPARPVSPPVSGGESDVQEVPITVKVPIFVVRPVPAEKPTSSGGKAKCTTGTCGQVEGPSGGEAPIYSGGESKCRDGSCGKSETPSVEQPQVEEPNCTGESCGQTEAPSTGKPPVYSGEQSEAGKPECTTGSCGQVEAPSTGDAPVPSSEKPQVEQPNCTGESCGQTEAPSTGKPPVYSGEQPEAGKPECTTGSCGQDEPTAGEAPIYSGEQSEAKEPKCTDGSCEKAPSSAEEDEADEGEEYCEE